MGDVKTITYVAYGAQTVFTLYISKREGANERGMYV